MHSAQAHNQLGTTLAVQGKLAEATAHFRQAVRLEPDFAEGHHNLGLALKMQGKLAEAVICYERALSLRPDYVDAHINLGAVRYEQNRLDDAAASFRQAVRFRPDFAQAHNNLGGILVKQGKLAEAVASCQRALSLKPDFAGAYNHLGTALGEQGKLAEAAASFRQAVRLKPDFAEALGNLGGILIRLGKPAEAAAVCEQAVSFVPGYAEAHINLGTARYDQGKLEEAAASYERALLLDPDNGGYHFSRAFLWLLQGDYNKGWDEYEWRWRRPEQPPRTFPQLPWQGEPLAGRTILLHAEQGFGDTLQFIRYAALIGGAGGKVLLECHQPALLRLLREGCPGVDQVYALGDPLPPFDVHAPLLSLPRLLGTTSVERIPGGVPYLHCDPVLVRRWRTRLEEFAPRGEGFSRDATVERDSPSPLAPPVRVGIVWRGSPANTGDHRRSVPLECFLPISRVPGVRLISLQKGPGSEQLPALPGLVDLGRELSDFADTAAALQSLDLVITVDTALAHLAGALGAQVWVALPLAPDWRWLLQRDDSPWYPTMRLFRQTRQGEWDEAFARIAAAVSGLHGKTEK